MKAFLLALKLYYNTIGLLFPKNSVKRLANLFSSPRQTVVRKKEVAILEKAKTSFIEVRNNSICIYEWGEGNDYALLCHGWESNAGSLGAMVEPLLYKGYRVITFDGPAHGKSSGKQASLIMFKEVIVELINKLGAPKIAIGHSLGSMATMLASSEIDTKIEKAVLIAPINNVSKVFFEFKDMINIPERIFKPFIAHLENKSGYKLNNLVFEKIAPRTKIEKALILHDVNDQITSVSHSEAIHKAWSNSNFIRINCSGHYRILWNESALNAIKEFI